MKYYINHIGYCGRDDSSDYLAHYGIKGMKWDPRKLKRRQINPVTKALRDRHERINEIANNGGRYIDNAKGSAASNAYSGIYNATKGSEVNNGYITRAHIGRSHTHLSSMSVKSAQREKKKRDAARVAEQLKGITKKKQSVSLDALKKRKKLYNSWSKK